MDRYNPLGDNSNSLCEYCGSGEPGVRCTIKAFIIHFILLFMLKILSSQKRIGFKRGTNLFALTLYTIADVFLKVHLKDYSHALNFKKPVPAVRA
jgi:hypothetical protein